MSSYIEPLRIAVILFPFLAFFISLPFFIKEYRKFGRFTLSKGVLLYSFVFYLLCAYFLVILPLPSRAAVAQMTGPQAQWRLGQSLLDFLHHTVLNVSDPSTYLPAMKQSVFLEPVFNILLFFPLGIYLRYYFKLSLKKTVFISFGLSLFFELTQLSGLYFIYPRGYRLFDVNDLLHNTLGGIFGYAFTPLLTFMLPTRARLDESAYEQGQQVTLIRRLVAMILDWIIFDTLICTFINVVLGLLKIDFALSSSNGVGFTLEVLLYFVLFNYLMNGRTIGKRIVKIQVVQEGRSHVSLFALFKRYGLLYLLFNYLLRFVAGMAPVLNSNNQTLQYAALVITLLGFGLILLYILNFGLSFILRKRVLFYEKASHTYTISTLTKED